MSILHISSYFSRSSLYLNLVKGISEKGFRQQVYIPCRSPHDMDKNRDDSLPNTSFFYDLVLKKWHRIFYHNKISTVYKSMCRMVDIQNVDLVHAHCLFSDGGLAYRLKREKGIPYIVAVRGTDINAFFRRMIHLRKHGVAILREADAVIFINGDNKREVFSTYLPAQYHDEIEAKCHIIPNGIDDYWHQHAARPKDLKPQSLSLLYVGNFSENKNIPLLIKGAWLFASQNPETSLNLTLVGGGGLDWTGEGDVAIKQTLEQCKLPNFSIEKRGVEKSKDQLRKAYFAADIYIMVSKRETFGLSYIEALSQATPIIYTSGQGVSSFFQQLEVGYASQINSFENISESICQVVNHYPKLSANAINRFKDFKWDRIVEKYNGIYQSIKK